MDCVKLPPSHPTQAPSINDTYNTDDNTTPLSPHITITRSPLPCLTYLSSLLSLPEHPHWATQPRDTIHCPPTPDRSQTVQVRAALSSGWARSGHRGEQTRAAHSHRDSRPPTRRLSATSDRADGQSQPRASLPRSTLPALLWRTCACGWCSSCAWWALSSGGPISPAAAPPFPAGLCRETLKNFSISRALHPAVRRTK